MYKTCHTEESSQRQRKLEQGLLEALRRQPYEKITLTDLCRDLNVPRKTFYRYFPTKQDCLLALMDHTLSDCNAVALTGWEGHRELQQMDLARFFTYWREQEPFLHAVRDNNLQDLLLKRTTVIVDAMKENVTPTAFPQDQVEYFIAHGLMTTVLRWHHFGFPCTAEEMERTFSKLLQSPDVTIMRLMF